MSGESQASRPGSMGSSNASLHSQAHVWRREALHVGLMPSRHARGLGLRTRGVRGPEQAWELPWDRPWMSQEHLVSAQKTSHGQTGQIPFSPHLHGRSSSLIFTGRE